MNTSYNYADFIGLNLDSSNDQEPRSNRRTQINHSKRKQSKKTARTNEDHRKDKMTD